MKKLLCSLVVSGTFLFVVGHHSQALAAGDTSEGGEISAPESKEVYSTPETIDGSTKVDTDAVVALISEKPNLVMVDARITEDRVHGYIEGSASLPDIDTTCDTLSKAAPVKSGPTLFYCNGINCGRSVRSVKIAIGCGYTDVYWYRLGFAGWETEGLPFIKPK